MNQLVLFSEAKLMFRHRVDGSLAEAIPAAQAEMLAYGAKTACIYDSETNALLWYSIKGRPEMTERREFSLP
jgi:hypothetical protein